MSEAVRAAEWGPMVVETDVDDAVIATLRLWLPDYLRRASAERGLDQRLPVIESFATALDDEAQAFRDQQLPAVLVTTASTDGDPVTDGNGFYYAAWQCVVSVVVRGRYAGEVRRTAALYGGSIRRLLVHKPDLGGFAGELKWRRGGVQPVGDPAPAQRRSLAAGMNTFTVYVDRVMQEGVGPVEPGPYEGNVPGTPDVPYDELAHVDQVTVSVSGSSPHDEGGS